MKKIKVRVFQKGDKKRFLPRYSGELSKPFWKAVTSLPKSTQSELYSLGMVLQDIEHFVLVRLENVRKAARGF